MGRSRRDLTLFWGMIAGIVALDAYTKRLAVETLVPRYMPRPVLGDWVRLRLAFNQGAAFGISLGPWSRGIFIVLTVVVVVVLWRMHRHATDSDPLRTIAVAMVMGGALGNVIDRLRSAQGVVDFVDVGIGTHRFPTFNVADMGVSVGAVLLALVLWREDAKAAAATPAPPGGAAPAGPPGVVPERSV